MNTLSRGYWYAQRGMATLAILILVGFAVSVAVFGALRFLQGSQSQTTAYHSQTQAQMRAWSGVDMLTQYLQKISAAEMKNLLEAAAVSPQTVNFNGTTNLAAVLYRVNNDLHASITGTVVPATKAEANSTIEVIFHQVEPIPKKESSGCAPLCSNHPQSAISFNRDLKLNGSIAVSTPPGTSYSINVKGLLDADGGNSITGVDTINATDSIRIGSGSSFNTLNSNGDIRLTGSVSGNGNLNARGNICLIGGTSANGSVRANGFVFGNGSAAFGDIQSIGSSTYNGIHRLCDEHSLNDSNGKPFGVNMAGDNRVRSVKSKASVRFNSGSVTMKPGVWAEGNLRDTNWGGEQFGTIGGRVEKELGDNPAVVANITVIPGYQVSITPVAEMSGSTPAFDAYAYEDMANYAFRLNATGYKVVTVRNVNGIPNGQYFLGSYDGPYKDRLCTALTPSSPPANAMCSQPVAPAQSYPLCWGYSDQNSCFSYDTGTKKWDIGGTSIAQGVAWFEGNLNVGNGTYYNTFIATGNITTSGNHKTIAPNFAGASGGTYNYNYSIQHNQWWTENISVSENFKGICSNATSPHYPVQLCNAFSSNSPQPIANYAYMAGSIVNNTYTGGNVILGATTNVFGSVLAGNEYNSGGSTSVFGYLTALGSGTETGNKMGGSTKIVITNFPKTYTPIGGVETGSGASPGEDESTPCKICLARDEYTAIKFSARYL